MAKRIAPRAYRAQPSAGRSALAIAVLLSLLLGGVQTGEAQPTTGSAQGSDEAPAEAGAEPAQSAQAGGATPGEGRRVKRWGQTALWSVVLLTIFLFGAAAIVAFSRRYREYLLRRPGRPTEYVDAWQMHKPPDGLEEDGEQEPGRRE